MALIGSINEQGELQGQINGARYLTGVITNASAVGGQVVGMRGLQGEKGDTGDTGATGADGQDGFSPSASVSKVDNVATITITDKDGTTTAEVYDGSGGGASAFIAEYGVTTYADVKDAYDEDAIILCTVDDSGNTVICQLAYYDDGNGIFYFAQPQSDGFYLPSIAIGDTWDDGYIQFASTDTATQLRNGLMDALDKQKLDGIASGAEVNVQSDWNEADSTDDAYIKNKPTIPSKNVWYGTCSTSSSVQQKSVTTLSGDFALDEGNILLVEFASTNSYDGATLSVDELTAKAIYVNGSPTNDHRWRAGEVVIFVYDGYHFNLVEQGTATTSYYGITKLSSSTSSTSELIAATPKAVKAAYDEATDATATPTASKKSKFDSSAHMNSTDMTTGSGSEVESFVNGLYVKGGGVGDYVVEQGKSGIWTYRKWNSGIAECWGTKTATLSGSSSSAPFSGYCYAFDAIAFPSALFNATPMVNVNGKRASNYVVVSYCSPSLTGVGVELQSNVSGSASCSAYIHAVGTWK